MVLFQGDSGLQGPPGPPGQSTEQKEPGDSQVQKGEKVSDIIYLDTVM